MTIEETRTPEEIARIRFLESWARGPSLHVDNVLQRITLQLNPWWATEKPLWELEVESYVMNRIRTGRNGVLFRIVTDRANQ